ncbi:hypothetical protein [Streptomyces sp. NPDC004270]
MDRGRTARIRLGPPQCSNAHQALDNRQALRIVNDYFAEFL